MSKKVTTPSKSDLMAVLRDLERRPSRKTDALTKAEEVADAALKEFCNMNPVYCRLSSNASRATRRRYAAEKAEREVNGKKIQACRNAVRLHGVTDATVAAIEKLVEELS